MYITRQIIDFGKRYQVKMGRTIIMCFLMSWISAAWMTTLGMGVALWSRNPEQPWLALKMLVVTLLLSIIKFGIKQVELDTIHSNSVAFKEQVRSDLMSKLFAMGPMLYDEERTGKLANMIWMKVDWLEYYFNEYLPRSFSMIVYHTIVSLFFLSLLGSKAIFYPISIMIVLITPNLFHREAVKRGQEEWAAEVAYSSDSLDGIQGIGALKALNYVEKHQKLMMQSTEKWYKATMKNLRLTTFENNFMSLFIQIAKLIVIIVMSDMLLKSGLTKEQFLTLIFFVIGVTDDAYNILGAWIKGAKGISGIDEIIEFVQDAERQECHTKESNDLTRAIRSVRYEDVHFAYQDCNILKQINMILPVEETTAIVGASGCGKSTLAYLLSGFYEPQKGTILTCTHDGIQHEFGSRKQRVTAVWQDSRVFHTTVYQNIVMGNCNGDMTDVIEAAKKANIHDKIMSLTQGYDTVIGDGGESLSGGEKQRIILARAFFKEASVLILDEATAYLDGGNAKQIQESIHLLSKGKAVLSIGHRLETVKGANRIFLMREGRIIDSGTHDELVQGSEEYRKLFGIVN